MSLNLSPHPLPRVATPQPTPIVDPEIVDATPVRIALPRVHLAGSNAHYDAHIDVGRHGLSIFLTPTAPYPSLDIDGTREELTQLAQALTSALARPERTGDRARFRRDRKRRLHRRERIQQLTAVLRKQADWKHAPAASAQMQDEGGPLRTGD